MVDKNSDKKTIETAKARFQIGIDSDAENRRLAIEDMQFRAGEQWPEAIKQQRDTDGRPYLTINKIPQNIHQITNDQRQNRPSIKIKPFDDSADVKTAEVLQGLIRSIENFSNADTSYDIGFDAAVTGGRGFVRVATEYADPSSFDQDIKIDTVHNPHCVVLDPSYREPDGSDSNWGFHFDDIPMDDFRAQYPDAEASADTFSSKDQASEWFEGDSVRVAEYFEKEFIKDTLYRLADGSTAYGSDIKEMSDEERAVLKLTDSHLEALKKAKATRETVKIIVNWYKINGTEILEQTIWPCQYIPIVPIHGEELFVDGKRVFEGIVRHAKDPQRQYNYFATCETEAIALAPKTPYIGVEGQFEGHEHTWNNLHNSNVGYAEYKQVTLNNGQLAGAPQRQFGEAPVQAITQARMGASEDMKSTTGIYDASLGSRSNESSGVAITRRTQQSQTSNFHFIDNLSRSIRHVGRIILELIPAIYDTKRVVRILGEDDEQKIVTINGIFQDENGQEIKFDFSKGKYDSSVTTGPSFASKKEEALDAMLKLNQTYPQFAQVAGDLMVRSMDLTNGDEIADRIKKTLDPNITNTDKNQIPPEIKAQLDQSGQVIDQLSQQLEMVNEKLNDKMIELESKERIEFAKIESIQEIKLAELKVKNGATDEQLAELQHENNLLNSHIDNLGFNQNTFRNEQGPDQPEPVENNLPNEMPLETPEQSEGMQDER